MITSNGQTYGSSLFSFDLSVFFFYQMKTKPIKELVGKASPLTH